MKTRWMNRIAAFSVAALLMTAGAMTAWADNGQAAGTQAAGEAVKEVRTTAEITSCLIAEDKQNIQIKMTSNGDMNNTDGYFYLFELKSYESSIGSRTDYLTYYGGGTEAAFKVALHRGTTYDRLYSKFVIAVRTENGYQEVS